jgi:peptidoglycan-associated lipoprotein
MRLVWSLPLVLAVGCAHPQAQTKTATNTNTSSGTKETPVATTAPHDESGADAACGVIRVHFDLNASTIQDSDKPSLEKAAQCLKTDKGLHVTIEGNADERGTEEYNLALGDQRARSVATYLERLGASGAQLKTVSYGKEQPECTEHDEACWSKNRRAAIKPTK